MSCIATPYAPSLHAAAASGLLFIAPVCSADVRLTAACGLQPPPSPPVTLLVTPYRLAL